MQANSFLFFLILFFLIYFLVKHNLKIKEKFEAMTANQQVPMVSQQQSQQMPMATQQQSQQMPMATQQIPLVTQQVQLENDKIVSRIQENKREKTPEENGIIFGYLPEETDAIIEELKYDSNAIYNNTNIIFNYKGNYLGMSNKNPLLPVFLEKLGTFTPYEYDSITIFKKSNEKQDASLRGQDEPIFYNKTSIYFQIKYLQNTYYLQFIPKNNTFYLSSEPSYFILLNSMDMNSTKEAKFTDSVLIQCLDNGEYLFEYESFLITEKDKSSTFFLKKSEVLDICSNFNLRDNKDKAEYLKQFLTKNEVDAIKSNANVEINRYITKLKQNNQKKINELQLRIQILEQKKSNLDARNSIASQKTKNDIDAKLKTEKDKLEKELTDYQSLLEKDYSDFKNNLQQVRGNYWLNEMNKLRKEICLNK